MSRTVDTREELAALDNKTVIIDQFGIVYQWVKSDRAFWQMGVSNMSGKRPNQISLPVLVIWTPDQEGQ